MINQPIQKQLQQIWDNYLSQGNLVLDTKGRAYDNIDESRLIAIKEIRAMIYHFIEGKLELAEFKTNLDSYNKQHNYWGFTAAKGQMFFNLLTKSSEGNADNYIALLKNVLQEPDSLNAAFSKMKLVFDYATVFQQQASDRRFVANPLSTAYFLSYFWQIHNPEKWPIMYSSIIVSFERLGIWEQQVTAYDNYKKFYLLNEEVKQLITTHIKQQVSNWDVEHALWHFAGTVAINSKQLKTKKNKELQSTTPINNEPVVESPVHEAGFELSDYLIPKVARLFELGASTEKSSGSKGREFETMVGEAFRLLDFDMELFGSGNRKRTRCHY